MIKEIYKRFKNNFYMTFTYSSFLIFIFFIVFILIMLFLNLFTLNNIFSFFIFILISSILLGFVTPSIYAYFVCNDLFDNDRGINVDFKLFIANRKSGKNPLVKSQLKIFSTIIYTYLIYLVSIVIFIFIISLIKKFNNNLDSFYGYYLEVMKLVDNQNYNVSSEKLITLYETYSEYINKDLSLASLFSSFLSFYYFAHSILTNLMKYYIINALPTMPLNHSIYKQTLKAKESSYYKDYYKLMYPYIISFIIIYFGVYLLLFYSFNITNSFILISSSIMICIFIYMPFFPLVLNLNRIKVKDVLKIYFNKYRDFFEMEVEREKRFNEILKQNSNTNSINKDILDKINKELNSEESDDNEDEKK